MSKILNETQVYPGWEMPKAPTVEEKALLITVRQNFIFSYVKTGAVLGIIVGAYNLFVKYDIREENFNLSAILTLIAFHVFAAGLIGYLLGIIFAKIYKK
ncbi:MAG: hypothetical protein JST55_11120 [Bacteroidetes bacterium]|nr:hypothetical protein [Bacteroidota bacterium]